MKNFLEENPENEKNLTASKFRRYQKLLKRDKSSKLAVASREPYERLGEKHVRNNKEVSREEVRKSQREIKAYMRAVNIIFIIGSNSNQGGMQISYKVL